MNVILIGLSIIGIFCEAKNEDSDPNTTIRNDESSEDSVFNVMPLKILLEHQLRFSGDLKQALEEDDISKKEDISPKLQKERFKTHSEIAEDEIRFGGTCDDIGSLKNFSLSEISKLLIGNHKIEGNSPTKKQLEKIYDSLKNCYFVRVRDAKLWGPLWHCINRLFLFFLVH